MKKRLGMVIFFLVATVQIMISVKVGYPPAEEQLKILNFFNIGGLWSLWFLRFITFILLLVCLMMWREIVLKHVSNLVAWWSCLLIFISPIFFVLWLIHPLITIKILVVVWGLYLYFRFVKKERVLLFGLMMVLLTVFVNLVLLKRPAIVSKFSLKEAGEAVTVRISSEDTLNPRISAPLWWRRVAYNKYFFVYKNVLSEVLPFFDVETIFFQEVHPMEQKSIVMFYWPEMYLFVIGGYFLMKIKNKKITNLLVVCLGVSLTNYLFSNGEKGLRMIFLILPISVILAQAVVDLERLKNEGYKVAGFFLFLLMLVTAYSFGVNFYDLTSRREYWFDNRPLAYQFWYENLKKMDLSNFSKIQVTTLIGDSRAYCRYYLGDICDQSKIVFNNFNAVSEQIPSGSVYAGFAGEFVGPKFKNDIDENWQELAESQGWMFVGKTRLRDTIANQYGNDIGLAVKR